jgi:hypothetical protein
MWLFMYLYSFTAGTSRISGCFCHVAYENLNEAVCDDHNGVQISSSSCFLMKMFRSCVSVFHFLVKNVFCTRLGASDFPFFPHKS